MGNDSGIHRKHKQRTALHKKHTVYPGMKISPEVTIVSGSIRPINRGGVPNIKEGGPRVIKTTNEDLWSAYDAVSKRLSVNGSAVPLQIRNNIEFQYLLAFKRLVKAGEISPLKDKYLR